MSPSLIQQMRAWIADCIWQDLDAEQVAQLSEARVIQGVRRHYAGGLEQFVRDAEVPA